jgi:hypothetical protein
LEYGLETAYYIDLSVPCDDDDLKTRLIQSTIRDILRHANDEDGRALNALDLPMEDGVSVPAVLSSDLWSWQHTRNKKLCKNSDRFPTSALRWALVSTAGTHSSWHTDTDGLCTLIQVQNEGGLKIWFVGVEKEGPKPFTGTSTFLEELDVDAPNTERWDVEAIVLTPGVKL